jgi:hypothetical protein
MDENINISKIIQYDCYDKILKLVQYNISIKLSDSERYGCDDVTRIELYGEDGKITCTEYYDVRGYIAYSVHYGFSGTVIHTEHYDEGGTEVPEFNMCYEFTDDGITFEASREDSEYIITMLKDSGLTPSIKVTNNEPDIKTT